MKSKTKTPQTATPPPPPTPAPLSPLELRAMETEAWWHHRLAIEQVWAERGRARAVDLDLSRL